MQVEDDAFRAATVYVESTALGDTSVEPLPDPVLLQLYGLFKQATVGPCASQDVPRPGLFDFKGQAKYEAWSKVGDAVSKEDARAQYVDVLTRCRPGWKAEHEDAHGNPKRVSAGSTSIVGPVFSVPQDNTFEDDEEFPPIIRCVQDGDRESLERMLRDDPDAVHQRDSEGCTCLHWAADKGRKELIDVLLRHGADACATDVDGLTPLEYALAMPGNKQDEEFYVERLG